MFFASLQVKLISDKIINIGGMNYKIIGINKIEVSRKSHATLDVLDNWNYDFCESKYGDKKIIENPNELDEYMSCYKLGSVVLKDHLVEFVKNAIYMSSLFRHSLYFQGKKIYLSIENEKLEEIINIDTKQRLRIAKQEIINEIQNELDEEETKIFWMNDDLT